MTLQEAEHLLSELRSGRVRVADLSGEQFQSVIFHKLIKKCGGNANFQYELLDDYHSAVDFVIREISSCVSSLRVEDAVHMFECKHYSRTLELSTVAKLLVVGIRYQPASLNIVSGTNLQPQVYEYARFLFDGLGNDAAMFRRTLFRHFRTNELLDWEIAIHDAAEIIEAVQKTQKKERIAEVSWDMTEVRPFSRKVIAASDQKNAALALNNAWSYRLAAAVFTDYDPDRLKIWVEGLPPDFRLHPARTEAVALENGRHQIRFAQMIEPGQAESPVEGHLELHISYATRSHKALTIPIAVAPVLDRELSFPDLRRREARENAAQLQRRAAPRLVFLGGAAGVGKTFLCESVAANLQLSGEFDVNRFSADAHGETTLLHNMFVAVSTPAAARGDVGGADVWRELAANLLKALAPDPETAALPGSKTEAAEILIPAFAELLVAAGPRLMVLRDAHLLSETAARELYALLTRLDDLGWGDVYWIIEYRSTDAPDNTHWQKFESQIRARVNSCLKRELASLTASEVADYLNSVFPHITAELRNAVWQMCGGVPLYLFNLLEHLTRENVIESDGGGRWQIVKPSAFRRLANTGLRTDGVLVERLKAVAWDEISLPEIFQDSPLVLVALLAIASEPERVEKLCELTGIDLRDYRAARRNLIRHNIIRQDDDEWTVNFQHDLMRGAAVEVGRKGQAAPKIVTRILAAFGDDAGNVAELEFYADLAAWVGFTEDAVQALNGAYERLRVSDNFTALHRILANLCQILGPDAFNSARNYTRYLASRMALAWATWNVGSLTEAQIEFSRVSADALAGADALLERSAAESYAADAERRVLGIRLELEDLPAFAESAESCVKLRSDAVAFNSTMNRLVLYCARFNHTRLGAELSKLSLEAFGDPEPESSAAVICSDIGALYRASKPDAALALYRQGVRLTTDGRQQLHNEMDVFIAEFAVDGQTPSAETLNAWRARLVRNDLRAMVCRLDLFRAFLELRGGGVDRARKIYRHLENSVAVYQYENFRLAILNDSMIAALLESDFVQAHRLQTQIVKKIKQSFRHRNAAARKIAALVPIIMERKKRFSHLADLEINLPAAIPAFSGVFALSLLNLETLAELPRGIERGTLAQAIKLWDDDDAARGAAQASFRRLPVQSGIDVQGIRLVSCAQ